MFSIKDAFNDSKIKYSFFMINNDLESMKICTLSDTHDKQVSLLYTFKLQDELRRANPDQINTFTFDYYAPLLKLITRDLTKINLR